MRFRSFRASRTALTAATVLTVVACANDVGDETVGDDTASGPSIEGSYRLLSRDLPDGSALAPPQVFGFATFTDGIRHFHIYQPGPEGGISTFSHVAEYELTDATYRHRTLYEVANDASVGGLSYSQSAETLTSAVTIDAGTVQFAEVGGGPTLVFTAAGLTATLEGQFVDHWEKVE